MGELFGEELIREVFARVRRADLAVAELFLDDAVLFYEDFKAEGRDAIRRFYRRTIENVQPRPTVEAVFSSPPWFLALVDLPSKRGHLHAVDVFEVEGSRIRQLEIYIRPERSGQGAPRNGP